MKKIVIAIAAFAFLGTTAFAQDTMDKGMKTKTKASHGKMKHKGKMKHGKSSSGMNNGTSGDMNNGSNGGTDMNNGNSGSGTMNNGNGK